MRRKKEAPTAGTVQGPILSTSLSYPAAPRLSTAAQIMLLISQTPEHADRLRAACWGKLETVLRRHYEESGAGL